MSWSAVTEYLSEKRASVAVSHRDGGGGVDWCKVCMQMDCGCIFSRSDCLRSLTEEAPHEADAEIDGKQLCLPSKFC